MPGTGTILKCGRVIKRGSGVSETMLFGRKKNKHYDRENKKSVLRCSICTGEQVAGFKDLYSGAFEEDMMISSPKDLEEFKEMYGIEGEIEKIY